MITYNEFKKYLDIIRKQMAMEDEINTIFFKYGTDSSLIGNDCGLIDSCMKLLSLAVGDEEDWIGWYLFEAPNYNPTIKHKDGTEFTIDSDQKLYNYIVNESNDYQVLIDKESEMTYDVDGLRHFRLKDDLVIKKDTLFTTGLKKAKFKEVVIDTVLSIDDNDDDSTGYLLFVNPDKLNKYFRELK